MKKKIVILGSTGSIGKNLINILKKDKKNFEIQLLTANKNINSLIKQVKIFNVKNVIVKDYKSYMYIKSIFKNKKINIYNNFDSIDKIFKDKKIDYVMSAISGLQGLDPTLRLIKFTKIIAIANKESIICGWPLISKKLKLYKTKLIPIDSEHYSIYSLIGGLENTNIENVYITASGGPFNKYPLSKFKSITLKSALIHPNWSMGKKITIDSATLMNKVFEIIEAKKIFNLQYKNLKILIHSKSYVHAMVKFKNGLTKILIHDTSMTIPIFNSLYENQKKEIRTKPLNFSAINNLSFENVNLKKFPVVKILKKLPHNNSLFETVVVAANDKLVRLYLDNKIHFLDISKMLLKIVNDKQFFKYKHIKPKRIEEIVKLNDYVSVKVDSLVI
ncbi:1-deoxy-D-xylulose-5-phosphate reductoisomerase [Candidatus Pelagibacter sp.]|nr:1-deoxy-D-xylulose-5-phosphate reductoisomerase [Candidatus Pelagibacter sp.]